MIQLEMITAFYFLAFANIIKESALKTKYLHDNMAAEACDINVALRFLTFLEWTHLY